jgi:hypothetical protein
MLKFVSASHAPHQFTGRTRTSVIAV